ncbi:hypothetical protein HanIR_Chr03g0133841 [Helianthus annuus]|nr:hypothetical protein HanIR_Chr03g0133841 [Helianthus annuus]
MRWWCCSIHQSLLPCDPNYIQKRVCVKEFDTADIDETGYYCSCFEPEQRRRFAIDIDEQTD